MVCFFFFLAAGVLTSTYATRSLPSPKAKLADYAYRYSGILPCEEMQACSRTTSVITEDTTPSGKLCMLGFAFERKPSGSSLTSGEAKNLRVSHEYPYSRPSPDGLLFLFLVMEQEFIFPLANFLLLCYNILE